MEPAVKGEEGQEGLTIQAALQCIGEWLETAGEEIAKYRGKRVFALSQCARPEERGLKLRSKAADMSFALVNRLSLSKIKR